MNKALVTHLFSLLFIVLGYFLNNVYLLNIGLFAISGSITNDLAVYMLFEKIPGFYGSGVIPLNFEAFKKSIYQMIMNEFFNHANLEKFFQDRPKQALDFDNLIETVDFSKSFDALVEVVTESQLGGLLQMIGGTKMLESFRAPFVEKLKIQIQNITREDAFQTAIQENFLSAMDSFKVHDKVSHIIQARLDELTPEMVKKIVEDMIKKHLGWLVVWGGVLGGLIGLMATGFSRYVV